MVMLAVTGKLCFHVFLARRATATRHDAATWNYGYNPRSEVVDALCKDALDTTVNRLEYSFDNIGNRITSSEDTLDKSYLSNELNQYTAITNPSVSPTYDADGNLLSDGDWTYSWDMENRLISAERANVLLEFSYDARSRRIAKKVTENSVVTKHEKYIYDGYKLIAVRNALDSHLQTKTFVWQPVDFDVPLCMSDSDNTKTYFLTDGNKNVTALFDSTGTRVASYTYAPFGALLSETGAMASANPIRFSSEQFDTETNLVYYNYRYYSPTLGRWLSRDPIAENGGLNLYAMVGNKPPTESDEQGLTWDEFWCNFYDSIEMQSESFVGFWGDVFTGNWNSKDMAEHAPGSAWGQAEAAGGATEIGTKVAMGTAVVAITAASAVVLSGFSSKVAIHKAHHSFGPLGKLAHLQIIIWKAGVKKSQHILRIILPWK